MFAKKLGRFTAGLFVTLGLVFGGSLAAVAGNDGPASSTAAAIPLGEARAQSVEFEWT